MRKIASIFLLIFVAACFLEQPLVARPVLAFGDLRGHLEPCGCDPRTDVGGIKRVSAAIERYRRVTPEVLVLNTGNGILDNEKDKSEADALIKSFEAITPSASLVNVYEWKRLQAKKDLPKIPWVLSNARESLSGAAIQNILTVSGMEVYGYLGLKGDGIQMFDKNLLTRWKRETKVKSSVDRVLIFSGSDAELKKLMDTKFFNLIISSNPNPLGQEVGDVEQKDEKLLLRPKGGKTAIWSVPFGGGGLLRLGGLELAPIPRTLEAIVKTDESPKPAFPLAGSFLTKVQMIHWLQKAEESGTPPQIESIFSDLRQASQIKFKLLVEERTKDIAVSEFVGAEACAACHQSSYDVWSKSKHAKAMVTLVSKTRHEDPTCVECHVVGFTAKGGYVNEDKTPKLSNVQCENCHGPRKQHVMNPLSKPGIDAKAACAGCHTPPHSPGFEMTSYWKQIEHK